MSEAAGGAILDRTRFRAVAGAAVPHEPHWRIVARFGVLRMVRTWYLALMLVLLLLFVVFFIGTLTYQAASGDALTGSDWGGAMAVLLMPALAFLLVAGAPLLAEDLRFNAPVFYFSRPLRVEDYLNGKLAQLGAFLGAATVVPMVLGLLVLLLLGLPTAAAPELDWAGRTLSQADREAWGHLHIDTIGDWLFVVVVTVPAVVVLTAFLGAVTMAVSAHTRRGWHAAVGVVVLLAAWSILGATAAEFTDSAFQHAFGPVGWVSLLLMAPLEARFRVPPEVAQQADRYAYTHDVQEGTGPAIALCYLLVLAVTLLAYTLTWRKVRAQEGLA